ncbi:MAG: TIGR01458 family HAD-type hydrolase [Flavobacteriaceae bacterium]|nr:TIGR01458 family HAD-type hydrolase [Flavobacteriaceae bacterium]|tara:strand:- start:1240 stop:2025 length:786 start_codon:yes stop_codon:yes gene_type:complete
MIKAFLFDLDGVFYVDDQLLPGANETLEWLQTLQLPYRFITNNTTLRRKKLTEKLNRLGLKIQENELVSANYAGVLYLKKQGFNRCRLVLREEAKGDYQDFDTTTDPPEAIVIGDIGMTWDYPLLNGLMNQLIEGAQMIALHKGRYFQTESGLTLDSGAFVAALEYAAETNALVVGKPEKAFFELATQGLDCQAEEIAMVGDDLINDIGGAQKMGYTTFLVKSGKFRDKLFQKSEIRPDHLIENIGHLKKYTSTKSLVWCK